MPCLTKTLIFTINNRPTINFYCAKIVSNPISMTHQYNGIGKSSSTLGSRCVPWLGEGLSIVLSSAISCRSSICPGRLSTAWLVSLVVFSYHCLQVVTREVHRSSLRRLICPAQDHFIFLTVLIISMTFVLSLTQMLVFLSLYVMLSILLSILVCAAASLFCACLVSVQVSAPYVIAGNTQELYTCLFRQMARLLLKMSRCLARFFVVSLYPGSFP